MKEMVAGAQKRTNGQPDAPLLPLIRLRVDYTGFSTINAQRFGQQFVGKVANPHDLLLFQKAPTRKPKARPYFPLLTSVSLHSLHNLIAAACTHYLHSQSDVPETPPVCHSHVRLNSKGALQLPRQQSRPFASSFLLHYYSQRHSEAEEL